MSSFDAQILFIVQLSQKKKKKQTSKQTLPPGQVPSQESMSLNILTFTSHNPELKVRGQVFVMSPNTQPATGPRTHHSLCKFAE